MYMNDWRTIAPRFNASQTARVAFPTSGNETTAIEKGTRGTSLKVAASTNIALANSKTNVPKPLTLRDNTQCPFSTNEKLG